MQARKAYRQVPNFNLIPLEYQRPGISLYRLGFRLLLVLVIIAEVFFIQNLYRQRPALEAATDAARLKIRQIEQKVDITQRRKALTEEHQALEAEWQELTAKQADWSQVLTALLQDKPKGLEIASVRQDGRRLNIVGSAPDYATLLKFRRVLLASPAIAKIVSLGSEKGEGATSFSLVIDLKIGGSHG